MGMCRYIWAVQKSRNLLRGGGIFVFLICLYSMSSSVYAAWDPEIDVNQLLQDVILQDKDAWDRTKLVDKIVDGRNIFEASLALETYNMAQAEATTFDHIFDHLQWTYEYCPWWTLLTRETKSEYLHPHPRTQKPVSVQVSQKDLVNVFAKSIPWEEILGYLESQRYRDSSQNRQVTDGYQESCKWIVWCRFGMPENLKDGQVLTEEDIVWTSTDELQICNLIVKDLYDLYHSQISTSLEYDENRDREIYYNNVLEEDRGQFCDINSELENIWKIMWSVTADLPKYSYFDPQLIAKNNEKSWAWAKNEVRYPGEYVSDEENIPEDSSFDNIRADVPAVGVPTESASREASADYLWSLWNGKPVIGPSWSSNSNRDRLLSKPKEWWLSSLITSPKFAAWDRIWWVGNIQNPQCEISELGEEDAPVDLYEEATDLADTLNRYGLDLDRDGQISQRLANEWLLTDRQQEEYESTDWPLIDQWALENDLQNYLDEQVKFDTSETLSTMQEMEEQLKACIEQHTDEEPWSIWKQIKKYWTLPWEVWACIREVMCKEIVDPSWVGLYRVRFCSRIDKSVRTPTTQKVTSVLDTMQSVHAVLEWMNNSGRMIRHKQSTELLENQVPNIKFEDMFSFGIDVITNTPRTTKNPKVNALMIQQDLTDIQKATMQEFEDLSILTPFVNQATQFNKSQVDALEQDNQLGSAAQDSVLQANAIMAEINKDSSELRDYYRHMATYEQVNHWTKIIEEHADFRYDMLGLTEQMRRDLDQQYKKMK